MEQLDKEMDIMDNLLQDLLSDKRIQSSDIMKDLMEGGWVMHPDLICRYIKASVLDFVGEMKYLFVALLALFILSAVVTSALQAFKSEGVARTARLFFILSELALLTHTLREVMDIAEASLLYMLDFLKLIIPGYMLCIATAGSGLTAALFYKLFWVFVYMLESIVLAGIFPVVEGYMLLGIIESVCDEHRFRYLMDAVKKLILGILRVMVMVVSGGGGLQLLITPSVDKAGMSVAQKVAGAIPGIGDIAESITGVTISSAQTLKNTFGVLILLIIVLIILKPAIQIFFILGTVKLGGAVGGLSGESRMAVCTDYMADAGFLCLRVLVTVSTLTFVSIAMLTNFTGGGI